MHVDDIAVLPITKGMSGETKRLRQYAPQFIREVIDHTPAIKEIVSLDTLDSHHVSPLSGGNLSAVYQVTAGDHHIIKFRHGGVMAEAKSLRAWARQGAHVVAVRYTGVVPQAAHQQKVKYIVLERVEGGDGTPAITALTYAQQHPDRTASIGRALGRELHLIHQAKSQRRFGEFSDMWGRTAFKTWNAYLLGYLRHHVEFLLSIGVSKQLLEEVSEAIGSMKFAQHGVYCHGDFSMRNALVVSEKPLRLKIFDPNPLIGHPSWDIAILFNNEEFSRRKYEKQPSNQVFKRQYHQDRDCLLGFIAAYEDARGSEISRRLLAPSRLMQMVFLLYGEYSKALRKRRNPNEEIEVIIRKEAVLATMLEILGEVKPRMV